MEASGTPPPEPTQPPPPEAPSNAEEATTGWRLLGVVLGLALLFAATVMVVAMLDIGDKPLRDDCLADPECTEYFDGSQAQKTIGLIFGWPSGVLAGVAALVAFYFAATGRHGQLLIRLTGAAIVLGGLSILVGEL